MVDAMNPIISVIIPIFNDAARLGKCLMALSQQTYEKSRFEIIVVDNGSDDLDQLKHVLNGYKNIILAHELIPGSYAARNHGLSLAQGEIIAFTDADCIPAVDWLERGIFHLRQTPNCGQVVGNVRLFFSDPQHPTVVELYESLTAFSQELLLQDSHGGATANVLTWRRVIDQVGPFDIRLKSNGDLEWGQRVFEAGYTQVYAPDVQVLHPARRSLSELHKRTVRLSGGAFDRLIKPDDSFIQKQRMFARLLLDDLTSPIDFVIKACRSPDLTCWQDKFKVSLVRLYVGFISAGEKIRLKFGGASQRG
ncbi:glycosyltransferase family 2 protein [Nodosilinea sp. E11]|uniref:glycosyltransferase n=1 Tax=Nodosilinea sp. E11 TaxID=3037479 RepID=UPI0029341425|nr:glycosyltransferase family 2 protein [Nodosilinea sp. E11]WOD38144.1 glycosyltransferase family 2 protein [Nodosilinea sp. E11]